MQLYQTSDCPQQTSQLSECFLAFIFIIPCTNNNNTEKEGKEKEKEKGIDLQ